MSKSKKKKKVTTAEREEQRRERQEMRRRDSRRLFILIAALIISSAALIAALVGMLNRGTPDGYTQGQYQRLQSGMEYSRVVKLLNGDDGELVSTTADGDEVMTWKNDDGSSITVTFRDDKVFSFDQTGLVD